MTVATDNPAFRCADVVENGFQLSRIVRVGAAVGFYLNRYALGAALKREIRLLAGGGPPEKELRKRMRKALATEQIFNHKSLPTRSPVRVVVQIFEGCDIEQVMEEPTIP